MSKRSSTYARTTSPSSPASQKETTRRFFLKAICGIEYEHRPELAPTQDILDAFKKRRGDWAVYERKFIELIAERKIDETIPPTAIDEACLLCSEDTPEHCHRRLVAEYLKHKWGDLDIIHL